MITVRWQGRLGNQLFEYAIGRILAEELGYALQCGSIEGFSATRDVISGMKVFSQATFTGQELDIVFIIRNKGRFGYILNGWFQRYEYYKPFKEKVRSWFNRDRKNGSIIPTARDIVIHIRRTQPTIEDSKIDYVLDGDFLKVGDARVRFQKGFQPGALLKANEDLLPFEYYSGILDGESYDRLFIVTDCPKDPFLNLFNRYHPIIISGNLLDDFNIVRSASKIIMSMSSFSWWSALLSEATMIYMPVPDYGIWGPKFKVKLIVNDESRYRIVPVMRNEGTFF